MWRKDIYTSVENLFSSSCLLVEGLLDIFLRTGPENTRPMIYLDARIYLLISWSDNRKRASFHSWQPLLTLLGFETRPHFWHSPTASFFFPQLWLGSSVSFDALFGGYIHITGPTFHLDDAGSRLSQYPRVLFRSNFWIGITSTTLYIRFIFFHASGKVHLSRLAPHTFSTLFYDSFRNTTFNLVSYITTLPVPPFHISGYTINQSNVLSSFPVLRRPCGVCGNFTPTCLSHNGVSSQGLLHSSRFPGSSRRLHSFV